MKKILLALLFVFTMSNIYAADAVRLEYKMKKNQVDVYENIVETKGFILIGKQKTNINSEAKIAFENRVINIKKDNINVESKITKASGFQGSDAIVNQKSTVTMNKFGKIINIVGAMGNSGMNKNQVSFPDKELEVGSKWTGVFFPNDPRIKLPIKTTYTLSKIDTEKKLANIRSEFSVSSSDRSKIAGAKSVKMSGRGTMKFDYENGKIVSNKLIVKLEQKSPIMLKNKKRTMTTKVTVKTKMKLKK